MNFKNPLRLRFQGKIIALLVAAVCLVQLLTLVVVQVVTERSVRDQLGEQLQVGSRIWQRFDAGNDRQMLESVAVLADDFGFKAAVSSGDKATMRSALINQSARMDADFGVLLDDAGRITVSLVPAGGQVQGVAIQSMLATARRNGYAVSTMVQGENLYRVALVPVLAPTPIAWVAMGTRLGAEHARDFSALIGLQASFVAVGDDGLHVYGSSLSSGQRAALDDAANGGMVIGRVQRIDIAGDTHFVLAEPIASVSHASLALLLQSPLQQAMAPYASISQRIALLTGLATLLALAAAVWLGRSVTRPLSTLAAAAHRLERGDYSGLLRIPGRDELAQLGSAFERMREGIAEREAQILHQANHDPLTGLPNRSRAIPEIRNAIAHHQAGDVDESCCAVLMFDLSRFKEINDTLGHAFGDQVLAQAGKRLRASVREGDVVLHLGGDEFLLLLQQVECGHAQTRAMAILQALREPLDLPRTRINLDASVGMALYPEHGDDPETLLRRADIALYDAKLGSQGMAVYRRGREEMHLRRLTLMSDLRQALARDELHLQFQPKIDLAADRVVHAEALLRWKHARFGMVAPDEFIPLAEHSGNVPELTRYVLRQALQEKARWRAEGLDIGIAVNLSAVDLMDAGLVEYIEDLLREFHCAPAGLVLEVTESALMRDIDYAVRTLRRLHGIGVRLAIDDFGTGYSSLAQLKRMPVDELKIDKNFVMRLQQGSDDEVIVRSTIELGHNMGLQVVAEGVEGAQSLALLRQHGCDMAQGYWFSPPLPGDALLAWCRIFAEQGVDSRGRVTALPEGRTETLR